MAEDGTISLRESVVGALFTLPLDESKADPAAAQAFVESTGLVWEPVTDAELAAREQEAAGADTLESLCGVNYRSYIVETITMQMENRMEKEPGGRLLPHPGGPAPDGLRRHRRDHGLHAGRGWQHRHLLPGGLRHRRRQRRADLPAAPAVTFSPVRENRGGVRPFIKCFKQRRRGTSSPPLYFGVMPPLFVKAGAPGRPGRWTPPGGRTAAGPAGRSPPPGRCRHRTGRGRGSR